MGNNVSRIDLIQPNLQNHLLSIRNSLSLSYSSYLSRVIKFHNFRMAGLDWDTYRLFSLVEISIQENYYEENEEKH